MFARSVYNPSMIYRKKPCRECRALFEPNRDWHSFCSDDCRAEWYRKIHVAQRHLRQRKIREANKRGHST